MTSTPALYALLAEFESPEAILRAAERTFDEGYRKVDAFTPFPVHGLSLALGFKKTKLPLLVLLGGILGAATAYGMEFWISAIDYPINVAGRPLNSWPAFIPVTFELTILFASLTAVFAMFGLNGLPRPYHPIFNSASFSRASRNRFFLCIEAVDPKFQIEDTRQFLEGLGASEVTEVES